MAGSMVDQAPPVTGLATPVRLIGTGGPAAVDDAMTAAQLHPLYEAALRRFPRGPLVSRGLPFRPPGDGGPRRWLPIGSTMRIDLGGVRATWLVLLAFCDAWRGADGRRPVGVPVGWVVPVGEPLVRVRVQRADGVPLDTTLRRRFEVNEGIIGWGSMAFLALPHLAESPVDWRGPHERQALGRLAPPGHAGPLAILPGSWGGAQTGVSDNVPSGTDDLMLWLHAIDVRDADGQAPSLAAIELEPLPGEGEGRLVVLAAITAFTGRSSPLRWGPRRTLRISGAGGQAIGVDMGLIARRVPVAPPIVERPVAGWGSLPGSLTASAGQQPGAVRGDAADELIELTAADDAAIVVASSPLLLAVVDKDRDLALGASPIRALAPADRRVDVTVSAWDGAPTAARVRILAPDGRVLAPLGHRLEVNPAIYEDLGAGLILDGAQYAYVNGEFGVEVPPAGATIEVVRGMGIAPSVVAIGDREIGAGRIDIRLARPISPDEGQWVSGDTHVHFLAPSTALLQARAEDVNVVHLLATQWGDHHTSTTDLGGDVVDGAGQHAVWVGSENRQNMLGHIGIVGTRRPVLPFASGGPPEGPIGHPVTHLMADWLATCRREGGLAIGAHFPLPMAEIAADIDAGLLDALEIQCFDETLESPPIREWYRYLDAGYRLPLVGGTDKMSAGVPLGQVRTWARLDDGAPLSFASWARAVRSGRTFVSSGPLLRLRVEGHEPGDELSLGDGATLEVGLRAIAAQPVIEGLEIVCDGRVVARRESAPTTELALRERIPVERTGWIAGRSRSSIAIGSAFASAMAAHTSPVYIVIRDRPHPAPDLRIPLALVDGTRAWLEALAPVRDRRDAEHFRHFLDEAERRLRARGG
jgi:hypothetical protein